MTKSPRYQTVAMTGMGETPRTDHGAYAVRVVAPGGHAFVELQWSQKDKAFVLHASTPISFQPMLMSNDMLFRIRKKPRVPRRKMPAPKDSP